MATRTVFVSRRLQCGAGVVLVMFVMFMVGIAIVGVWPSPPEEPQEVLKAYNRLARLSKSLDKMALELSELDWLLARTWEAGTSVELKGRMWLQREVNDLGREYAEAAGNYNWSMRETSYRFADPAKLPAEAKFGSLPRRHEPFILLKSGPRA